MEIKDDTVLLAVDMSGGMCDRLMLGKKGLVSNANVFIEALNIIVKEEENYEEIRELLDTNNITDEIVEEAISILIQNNFTIRTTTVTIVTENYVVARDIVYTCDKNALHAPIVVDINEVKFDKDNMYCIL